jgi:G2/mitotic-specific cyclin 1/2
MYNLTGSFQHYLLDSLRYQLQASEQMKYFENFQHVTQNAITEVQRENFLSCVSDLCSDLNLSTATGQLACMYIDKFLSRKPLTQSRIFELLGLTALSLASKYKEGTAIRPEEIQKMLAGKYSIDAITTTENYMVQVLDWQLSFVTPCDLVQSLVELTFGDQVSKRLLDTAFAFSAMAYADFKVACSGNYNVAVSSILLALKKCGHSGLEQEWLRTLENYIPVDREKVQVVIDCVLQKLENCSSE